MSEKDTDGLCKIVWSITLIYCVQRAYCVLVIYVLRIHSFNSFKISFQKTK